MKRKRSKLGPRIDLPPLDHLGPWPKALRPPPFDATGDQTIAYYLNEAQSAWQSADEQRRRRLEIEEELDCVTLFVPRPEPVTRFVERKVYKPMPPREVFKRITIERHVPRVGPCIVVTPPDPPRRLPPPDPVVFTKTVEVTRPLSFFGRLGDRIDRLLSDRRNFAN